MNLLDKQSVKLVGVKDFCWSPKQNIISYFVPETENSPAKVILMEIPTRKELRQKNLFSVSDCKMHWQSDGRYLCVKVDRHNKTKKSTFFNFELFRVFEKDIPIEQLEMKETVHAFAWEPKGTRFAIIHGESAQRPDISFYTMGDNKLKHLKTLEKKPANHLFWSPQGKFVVLAGLRTLNGLLEFFNVDEMETMGTDEHTMCTAVDWDPSGRFVSTTVSFWRHQLDTGYNIFLFNGKSLYKVLRDRFCQLLWRPRPPSLLSDKQIEHVRKTLDKFKQQYELEDMEEAATIQIARRAQLDALRQEFVSLVKERERELNDARAAFRRGLGLPLQEEKVEEVELVVEELLDVYEEVLL